ncbi:MAG: mechanosensitive ion channel family protein [Thermoplasmatales archaeon]|nr:mechanosensitive ion channel family protein [Thermoplasmatales archaeon]MCW6169698.1 mechanosensitive ion channel family protein [Thermoplasmatales archaeon]
MPDKDDENQAEIKRLVKLFATLIVIVIIIFAAVILLERFLHFPPSYSKYIYAVVIGLVVYIIVKTISKVIETFLDKRIGKAEAKPITMIIMIIGYFIVLLAVLAALGINVSSVILSAALFGAVIGLATQTILSNIFAGLILVFTKPFKVGDYVTINAWQFGKAYPTIAPKYFSVDRFEAAGYSGVIENITLNYTKIHLEGENTVTIPNGVLMQASFTVIKGSQWIQARFEVPKTIRFDDLRGKLISVIEKVDGYAGESKLAVDETTMTSYIIIIRVLTSSRELLNAKGKLLEGIMDVVEPLKK